MHAVRCLQKKNGFKISTSSESFVYKITYRRVSCIDMKKASVDLKVLCVTITSTK